MKKRLLALGLCLGMVATAMVGCDKDTGEEETTGKSATKAEIKIERADYFGVEVEESYATLTDEDLEEYIQSDLEANATTEQIDQGVLEEGMTANIDYAGTVDGEEYASKEGLDLVLSDGNFAIEGFIDGIIGKSVGDEFEMTLQFPAEYEDADYAGKDIVFSVKVNYIVNTIIPELTDEYVQEVYSYLGLSTVEEYKAEYRKTIINNQIYNAIWETIVENVEVVSYDSEELEALTTTIAEQQELTMTNYGYTLDSYLELMSMSSEDFIAQCEESAKYELKYNMIRDYIAETEGISITDEEYNAELKKTMVAYGMETEEEFYEYFATYGYDEQFFKDNFLMNKVVEFVCDNVVVVPDAEEETTASDETETTAATE